MRMRDWIIGLVFIGSLQGYSIFEILGGQKVGTTSAVFLKIGVGARAAGLGETYVSFPDDPTALYWNPGTLGFMKSLAISATHTAWLADIPYEHLALVVPQGAFAAWGIQIASLQTPYQEVTDELHPFGTGEYWHFADVLVGLAYGRQVSDRFSFGVGIKYLDETLWDLRARGLMLDLGTLYWVGYRDIKIGMSVANFGPDIRPQGGRPGEAFQAFPLPVVFRAGISGTLLGLTFAFQLDKPSDDKELLKAGLEKRIGPLALRAGYRLNGRPPGDFWSGLALGMGARVRWKGQAGLELQYAYTDWGHIGGVNRLSLALHF